MIQSRMTETRGTGSLGRHLLPIAATLILAVVAGPVAAARPVKARPAPPAPGEGPKDWIQLPAGEWLAGEIKFMRNEEIEFDSDKMDVRQFDWSDIVQLRSPRVLTFALTGKRVAMGTATLRDSVLRVQQGGETQAFRRADLLSIIEGKGNELDLWSGNLSAGLDVTSGNTDQATSNIQGLIRRDGTVTRFDLRYSGNLGELNGVESVNNHFVSARMDQFLSRLLFVTPLALEFYADRFQNIALRATVVTGLGYFFVRRSDLEWFVLAGGGYLSTRHKSVAAGEGIEDQGGALTPGTSVEWDITKDIDLDAGYSLILSVPNTEDWFHHFNALLSIENLKIVDLTASVTWDRTANPAPREDGSIPKKDDLRTTFGIGIEF